MLKGITNKKDIKNYRKILQDKLDRYKTKTIPVKYSSPGGVSPTEIASYSEEYNVWWYFSGKEDQYWNPFGKGEPKANRAVTGRCQINMNKEGLNRRLGGAFAVDENGTLFLMHNGTLGGGQPGISKRRFQKFYTGPLFDVDFDGISDRYFIVAELDSPYFMEQIVFFVDIVYEFKEKFGHASYRQVSNHRTGFLETLESTFRSPFLLPEKTVIPFSDHARITNALNAQLKDGGYSVERTNLIDACVIDDNENITTIFEVKCILHSQSLYTAIGQLMYYGLKHRANYYLVTSDTISNNLINDLKRLGIFSLTFKWINNNPVFGNLSGLI